MKVALFFRIGPPVHDRPGVGIFDRRLPPFPSPPTRRDEVVPVTQVLTPEHHDEQDVFPSPDPSPRVDKLPASGDPETWTAAERQEFRVMQSEMQEEHERATTGYAKALGALLKRPMLGEPPNEANQGKRDDTKREKEIAIEYFKTLPREQLANQRLAKPHLDELADLIVAELDRSKSEVRRRLPGYLKDFLKTHK
jgi:hypothetical protein